MQSLLLIRFPIEQWTLMSLAMLRDGQNIWLLNRFELSSKYNETDLMLDTKDLGK